MCTHISSTYSIVSQRTKNNYNSVTKWKKYNNKVFIQLNDMCHVVLVVSHMRFLQKNDLGSIKLTGRHLDWNWLAILLIQLTKLFLIALFILVCLKAKTKHSFQSTGTSLWRARIKICAFHRTPQIWRKTRRTATITCGRRWEGVIKQLHKNICIGKQVLNGPQHSVYSPIINGNSELARPS